MMSDYNNYLRFKDPIKNLESWFEEALAIEDNASAFTLSTVSKDGLPNARTLLLKDILEGELLFFTNYDSPKGRDIEENNHVAMTFYWHKLARQVRVLGKAKKCSEQLSKMQFHSRAYESQVASAISKQGQPVENRQVLEDAFRDAFKANEATAQMEYPKNWGGYLIEPYEITFFIYGDYRLNDRFQFKLEDSTWKDLRLYP